MCSLARCSPSCGRLRGALAAELHATTIQSGLQLQRRLEDVAGMRRAQQPGQTRKAAAMCAETLSGGNAAPALTRRDGCLAPPALHLLSSSSHAGFTLAGSSLIHTAHSHAVVLSQAAAALWLPLLLAQLQRCPSAPRALLLLPLSAAASSAVRCCRGAPACCCPPARSSSRRVELLTRRAPRAGSPPPRAPVGGGRWR